MYFDGNDGHDLSLVHSDVRTHAEVERVAAQAENEIVARFTERRNYSTLYNFTEGLYTYTVMLRGYDADETAATGYTADRTQWTGFAKAFRQTVADVTSYRLRRYEDNAGMKSERIDGYQYERFEREDDAWPTWWDVHLRPYDERTPVFI